MAVFKCKMCGGSLEINNETIAICEYCGTKQTLPKLSDERRVNLYDRANHFRRNNEFDKAMSIYEQILNEDTTDAETYWSLVLCRYGIEYVEDPSSHKRIPTVNRAQFTSIFDDNNYKSALQYADENQRSIYEAEAKTINDIQKGILEISQKEEPFDVFICYKESDNNGRRTPDSVLAQELYFQLKQEGFKVFFSRITLEDKLGTAYEPYIFAALNSAKVMVVLGTRPEHFNAVWVKNEWSRYLSLIKNGAKKVLIPAYKDMDPYDLPEEFSHLQAQDMSKLGFMQDLIRGIKKLAQISTPKTTVVTETVVANETVNISPLLKRAFMFLEDGEWDNANEYCERILDIDPECAQAYLGKLMANLKVRKIEDLGTLKFYYNENPNYQKAYRFADKKLKDQLDGYVKDVENGIKEDIYLNAVSIYENSTFIEELLRLANTFNGLSDYKESQEYVERCYKKIEGAKKDAILANAKAKMESDKINAYKETIDLLKTISGWKDADECIVICERRIEEIKVEIQKFKEEEEKRDRRAIRCTIITLVALVIFVAFLLFKFYVIDPSSKYNDAVDLMNEGKYVEAVSAFTELGGYKDSEDKILECKYNSAITLMNDGKYEEAVSIFTELDGFKDSKEKIEDCKEEAYNKAVELMNKGEHRKAISYLYVSYGFKDSKELCKEIIPKITEREFVSAHDKHTVALKSDGTVVAIGNNSNGKCDVSNWTDIVAISAGNWHTVGLKSDGTVVAIGSNSFGQCDVSNWTDIVAISAGDYHTVGLKSDGTVVAIGSNSSGQCDVSNWTDIVAISAGKDHVVGLKSDGTVVAVGENDDGQCDVSNWTDIVAISAGAYHTVGLKSDGTVVAVGSNVSGRCDVNSWTDIVAISAGGSHTVGLKADGTVVATGYNDSGACDVSDWTDIVAISAGESHTVGLKSDGTVVAVGDNYYGQCDVSDWKNIKVQKNK